MTLTAKFRKTTVLDTPATYKGFTIDYMGDRACIRFDYSKPRHGVSNRHEKFRTISTNIEVRGETYSLDSLGFKIQEMESSAAGNLQDVQALRQGLKELKIFIEENGTDNPFECDSPDSEWKALHPILH